MPGFDELIANLTARDDLPDLYAVTSLGKLRLTTAPSFVEESKHPCIWILVVKPAGNCSVAFVPPGARRASAEKRCAPDDLISTLELFLLRLALEH